MNEEKTTIDLVLLKSGGALLLTTKQVARLIGVAPKTIHNWVSAKTFPIQPVAGFGLPRYRAEDVAAALDSRRAAAKKRGRPKKGPPEEKAN